MPHRAHLFLLVVSCLTACSAEDEDDQVPPDCEFSAISGTWFAAFDDGLSSGTLEIDRRADFGEIVGGTELEVDFEPVFVDLVASCHFDMVCADSGDPNQMVVHNALVDTVVSDEAAAEQVEFTCTEAYYLLTLGGDTLTVGFMADPAGLVNSELDYERINQ